MLHGKIRHIALRIIVGVAAALLSTGAAYKFHFNLSSATSLHLFLITAIALRWGFLEASAVSLVSVACLDYFFTVPLFQFYMADSHDWVALGTFESVALLVSRLSNQVNQHALESDIHRSRLQRLYELSQSILLLDFQHSVDQQLTPLIQTALQAKGVGLWNAYDLHFSSAGQFDFKQEELQLRASFFADRNDDDEANEISRRVLRSGTRSIGALLLYGHTSDAVSINAAASLAAIAMERARSFAQESNAEAARQSEQLRATVLDSLAHAFKTPLTTIQTSSSGLLEMNTLRGTEKKLVTLIDQQAHHLNDITTRLLRAAKIDSANLKVKREHINVVALVRESVAESAEQFMPRSIIFAPAGEHISVLADRQLLKMALLQLLDNAAKYGGTDASITLDIHEEKDEAVVSVHNEGSFIPLEERGKIFKRFYRSPGSVHKASGTGIGLSVVKHVVEAHQGRVWVVSDSSAGTTFFLTLPSGRL